MEKKAGTGSWSTPDSNSWLPNPIRKKPKVLEASNEFNSQTNLLEFLASSFNRSLSVHNINASFSKKAV